LSTWSSSPDLDGRVVIVSGGSRGIGLAIAQSFVDAGATAVITGRSQANLDSALKQFGSGSDRVVGLVADAASEEDADRVISETRASLGRIDTLVNNAATTARFGRLVSVPLGDWDAVMRTNLRAPMVWSRLVQPIMSGQGGGSIINIGSSEGTRLTGGLGTYAISKAALQMLTRVCAREWASDGIRVNYLAPGVIDTEFSADLVDHIRSTGRHINPMEMIGTPDDVGFVAVMLSSEGCRFVTGAAIAVDGGETA
jgi:NAD(P)-dependent dehydrogenase (short-subunit alcohol dehydrogenase family)